MAPNLVGSTNGVYLGPDTKEAEPVGNKNPIATLSRRDAIAQTKISGDDVTSDQSHRDKEQYEVQIVWRNVAIFIVLHAILIYSWYLLLTLRLKIQTVMFTLAYVLFSGFGITAGAHRLWAHRSYKAKLPLRIFLMLAQSAALQNDIHEWVRDHRVHHKFTDTNADPHNASRGFFFSHMGWLLCRKHKDVITKGKTVDMSDVLSDSVVRFQMRYYIPLIIVMNIVVPSFIPWYFWSEDGFYSLVTAMGRYVIVLHGTWLVNSAAHIWGMKPYDEGIKPTENKFVAVLAFGEGWHNYHHVFPWDYKAAELGDYGFNFTTCFLDLMARIGWATELKTASEDMIRKRSLRTGDGSYGKKILRNNNTKEDHHGHHHHHHIPEGEMIWGWGDKDMDKEEIIEIQKINRMKA